MAEGFLEVLDRHGLLGKAGCDGPAAQGQTAPETRRSGRREFAFATGIECSNPVITDSRGRRIRRDLLEECGHYDHWREDLELTRDLGLRALRYGLPLHKVFLGPDRYDWSFADEALAEAQRLNLIPILDLCHFGLPDWLGDFQNPEFPVHFARYAGAVAERYPWVRFFTPVNEIYVCARNSGKEGLWNERLKTDRGFVTAMKHLVAANLLATDSITRSRPNAVFIQSESAEYIHHVSAAPSHEVKLHNKLVFLSLDLLYSKAPDSDVLLYLLDNGMSREEFTWFMQTPAAGFQIMGNDYYGHNEKFLLPDGRIVWGEDGLGWYQLTHRYYKRYYKPLFHTETNLFDPDLAPLWLWKQWINVLRMRRDGIPVLGFTWYSLVDQVDWDIQLAEQRGKVNPCGLFDLNREPRPVAAAYRMLLGEFSRITALAHGEMFELTSAPSMRRHPI
jgi:beta-glucosidase/6-phospho-beta-glucosidase/beta-galactosidase